jgi:CDP-diacylglycerol--serine O-phosphatidyltransferase
MNDHPSRIYLLPNLMTAGNLFCGFTATLKILEGALLQASRPDDAADLFHAAIWFILGAFVFDFLDGRLARLGGHESAFGREFDSLADIVSFGLAPALMVYRIVLQEFPRACWIIAFVYLACGALRLARFNTAATASNGPGHVDSQQDFTGFPIPAAAGLIASITLFLLWLAEGEHHLGRWKFVLPPVLLFLSFMMFSRFQYPSFKALNWKTKKSIPRFLVISVVLVFTVMNYEWMPAVLFLSYLLYGFLRPWLSREWRREIEEEFGEEPPAEPTEPAPQDRQSAI